MGEKIRRFLIIPATFLGVAIFMVMTKGKSDTPRVEQNGHATPVRFITVTTQDFMPIAIGHLYVNS